MSDGTSHFFYFVAFPTVFASFSPLSFSHYIANKTIMNKNVRYVCICGRINKMSFTKGMKPLAFTHTFTKEEEIVHAITHGIGAVFSIAALVILTVMAAMHGNAWHIVSFTLFGSTMLVLYVSSTIVHALPEGRWKRVFEIFDHSSIYFLSQARIHRFYF